MQTTLSRFKNLSQEDRDKAALQYGGVCSATYCHELRWSRESLSATARNFESFMYAVVFVSNSLGRASVWVEIWTALELERLEGGNELREAILHMEHCDARLLKKFVGDSRKPLGRCLEYLELLLN